MKKHKFKTTGASLGISLVISFLILALCLTAVSLALSLFKNPRPFIGIGAIIAFLSSGALSASLNAKIKGEGGTLFAILSAFLAAGLFFAIGLVASRGNSTIPLLMNILCYFLVSALFAKLSGRRKKRYKRH